MSTQPGFHVCVTIATHLFRISAFEFAFLFYYEFQLIKSTCLQSQSRWIVISAMASFIFRNIFQRPLMMFLNLSFSAILITTTFDRKMQEEQNKLLLENRKSFIEECSHNQNIKVKDNRTIIAVGFYWLLYKDVRVLHYLSLSSPCKRTESFLRALLTALCKWLAGGNDFTKKVTPPPAARINEPFIHFCIYKKRTANRAWRGNHH